MRWWQFSERRHCPHSRLRGIFGDEIHARGGRRLLCLDCGRTLNGSVKIAGLRSNEKRAAHKPPTVGPKGSAGDSGAARR